MSDAILLVEDDAGTRNVLVELLVGEGYSVVSAANGHDALERLQAGLRPGVIVMDLTMPVMDGWEFRARQSEDPALESIPLIVTTGMPLNRIGPMPGVSVVPKPLDLDSLVALIRSRIGEPGAASRCTD